MGIFEERDPNPLPDVLRDPFDEFLEEGKRRERERRLLSAQRFASKIIRGSKAYERMSAGEIGPEQAAAELKQEATESVQEEIERHFRSQA